MDQLKSSSGIFHFRFFTKSAYAFNLNEFVIQLHVLVNIFSAKEEKKQSIKWY